MITPELLTYIKAEQANGRSTADIVNALKSQGWQDADVQEGFSVIAKSQVPSAPAAPVAPQAQPTYQAVDMAAMTASPLLQKSPLQPTIQPILQPTVQSAMRLPGTISPQPTMQTLAQSPLQHAQVVHADAHPGHKAQKIIFLVIGLLLFCGVAYAGYIAYGTYFGITPEQRILASFKNVSAVTSVKAEGKITTTYKDDKNEVEADVAFTNHATNIKSDDAQAKGELTIDITATTPDFGSVALVGGLEYRVKDKTLYVQLTKVPSLGLFLDQMLGLQRLKNQWVKADMSDVESTGAGSRITSASKLSEEEIDAVRAEHKDNPKFKILEEGNDEINGQSMYRYKFQFDAENMKAFSLDLAELSFKKNPEVGAFKEKELEEINKMFTLFNNFTMEVWIGKSDNLPYKLVADIDAKDLANISEPKYTQSVPVRLEVVLSNYNEPVNVTVPEGSKTYMELYQELFGPRTPTPTVKSPTTTKPAPKTTPAR